jgi:hypothetical protein
MRLLLTFGVNFVIFSLRFFSPFLREILETAIIKLKIIRGGRHEKIISSFGLNVVCFIFYHGSAQARLQLDGLYLMFMLRQVSSGNQAFVRLDWNDGEAGHNSWCMVVAI